MDPLARISDTNLLHPTVSGLAAGLVADLKAAGIPLEPYETFRNPERQVELYKRGRVAGCGPLGRYVTHDTAWTSRHQYGTAVDMVFKVGGKWTWAEPEAGMWKRFHELAAKHELNTLTRKDGSVIEWPHVQHSWPLIKLRNGEYPPTPSAEFGPGKAWADYLNAATFRWGPKPRRIAAVDHPAAPPRAVVDAERPALDSDVFPSP